MRAFVCTCLALFVFSLGCEREPLAAPSTGTEPTTTITTNGDAPSGDIDIRTPGADVDVNVDRENGPRIRLPNVDVNVERKPGGGADVDVNVERRGE